MSELFERLGQWLANFSFQLPLQEWLVDLIHTFLDLFKNIA